MTKNTWQKLTDSFSEGMFQLSLPQLDSIQLIEPVVCGIYANCGQLWLTGKLRTRPTPLPLLINTQHYSLFKIVICLLWRQTPLIKDIVDSACATQSQDCAHMLHAISRLPAQSQDSENVQRNLKIVQILGLCRTYTAKLFSVDTFICSWSAAPVRWTGWH